MNRLAFQSAVGLLLAIWLASAAMFQVKETELAIKFRLKKIVATDYEPGLHFMVPLLESVQKFDRRVLTRNYPAEQFLTSEGKILNVDFYVKWRISDVEGYYLATNGDEEAAASRLAEIVKDGLKGVIAKRTIQQVVAAERSEFIGDILKFAGRSVQQLGLTLVDVRVKRIDLPEEVSESVYNRMRQNFARQASQLRAEGDEQAQQIRAEAERERVEVLAMGNRDAEVIRGEGDAKAAAIYAAAYQRYPDFYSLHRSLEAYRNSVGKQGDILVISPKGEFFKYLKQPGR
ncbi:MAG TPA: protease modulator HflC [Steroidobacteraceae bacterium]|jgi:membrane protease subunit HflC|nr:protease modulator HflC [Steroidobacteraceae bacterium]